MCTRRPGILSSPWALASGSAVFGGSGAAASSLSEAQVVIIPVPYDGTTTYLPGTRQGPAAILHASQHLELFDEETAREVYRVGIATLEEMEVDASGPRSMVDRVRKIGEWAFDSGLFPLMLGGEHLLSLGMIKAAASRLGQLSILQLDAHADMRSSYQGTECSNACVMRLASEYGAVVPVGIRSLSQEEHLWLHKHRVPIFYAAEIQGRKGWEEEVLSHLGPQVYVTIDLDVFDPAEMPAVGTPEPGGLHWYEVLRLLRLVSGRRRLVAADVMELCPLPANRAPDFLAAKLAYKVLAYRFSEKMPESAPT